MTPWKSIVCRAAALAMIALLSGCAAVQTVPLTGPPPEASDTHCGQPVDANAPAPTYTLRNLKNCTAPDTFIVFAFSGGGMRSASFGYGVLGAAHAIMVPDANGGHPLDRDISIVSGVSGGSFTAAAFASKRDRLFPAQTPDYYRDNFLTHDFSAELLAIYLEPWRWQWMLPNYGTNDEMAKVFAGIDFSSHTDKVFDTTYGDLARKGRPLLIVQATDFGNEQPFTFTQNDFDLICSNVDAYPVANAIAASTGYPILFSPIVLANHHFDTSKATDYCANHRPKWVDDVLSKGEPVDLSRLYTRARIADGYLPHPMTTGKPVPTQRVFLQDGGVSDNVALRGLSNIVVQHLGNDNSGPWDERTAAAACHGGWGRIRKVVVVAVDGESQPNNKVSSMSYLTNIGLIFDISTSAAIDASGTQTMFATEALTRAIAAKLETLDCDGTRHTVTPYFARVSFENLNEDQALDGTACGKFSSESCTIGDLARTSTSLSLSGPEVDANIRAGRSAFACNLKIAQFLKDSGLAAAAPDLPCPPPAGK
jgi:NTE family protein